MLDSFILFLFICLFNINTVITVFILKIIVWNITPSSIIITVLAIVSYTSSQGTEQNCHIMYR